MKLDRAGSFILGMTIGLLIMISVFSLLIPKIEEGIYRKGQIDAINGIIKYELILQEDGSTEWEEINEGNE
jgi:hypothetical protein